MSSRSRPSQRLIRGDAGQVMAEYALVLTIMVSAALALPPIANHVTALVNVVAGHLP
jgi:hypothetical protein